MIASGGARCRKNSTGVSHGDTWTPRMARMVFKVVRNRCGAACLGVSCLMDREDVTERLQEIHCPALITHGTATSPSPLTKRRSWNVNWEARRHLLPLAWGHRRQHFAPKFGQRSITEFPLWSG